MRFCSILTFAALFAAAAGATQAQPGVPGVLGADGAFHPMMAHAVPGSSPTRYTGTLDAAIGIDIVTPLPAGATIHCVLNAAVANGLDLVFESAQTTAAVSGAKATCAPSIAYQWFLYNSNDVIALSYQILATDSAGDGRNSTVQFATLQVPASGKNSKFTLFVRL
jgi:hypothetical protein